MGKTGKGQRRLSDGYSFAGFRAQATIRGVFGDRDVRIVTLDRRSKKLPAAGAGERKLVGTIRRSDRFAIFRAESSASSSSSRFGASRAAPAAA